VSKTSPSQYAKIYPMNWVDILPLVGSVIVISLSGVMAPGPMFAMTVAKSYRTPWAGAQVSLGHAVIEVPLILLIYFGFGRFFQYHNVQLVLSLLGGGMIIWLGIGLFRARAEVVKQGKELQQNAFVAGIILSGLNPFFLLWWATVGLSLVAKFLNFGTTGLVVLVTTHWLCDLAWLSLVAILIYRTQKLYGKRLQAGMFIICSLLMIYVGGTFLYSAFKMIF
jgi:threonine/homoserine/homoserine lactone efflux protein